jgi:hypothetical protein
MHHISINILTKLPRCLLAIAVVVSWPTMSAGQDTRTQEDWIYAFQNQPSGEFAPDYRKTDPFRSILSDADRETLAAKSKPSFLAQVSSQIESSAFEDTDEAATALLDEYGSDDQFAGDGQYRGEAEEYEFDAASPSYGTPPSYSRYTDPDELMSQDQMPSRITPQQVFSAQPDQCSNCYGWHVLPKGLLYKSYVAGEKEPRMQFVQLYDTRSKTRVWDAVLGGRMGLLRNGSYDSVNPQGFQLDLEGAVFARVLPDQPSAMLAGSDYRAGLLGTHRYGGTAYKWGYYHISSHIGDEFLIANPTFNRLNYVRDSAIAGVTQDLNAATQVYGEIAYALGMEGGAKPLEFQLGAQYQPVARSGLRGAPYLAANYHIREDFDFHGGANTVAGWSWQGAETRHRFRIGLQYYNGPSMQYQFLDTWENMYGGGFWFDY